MDAQRTKRPPVVAILGHVDHGKTSLVDCIRKTNMAEKEPGNITQHIRGYEATHHDARITFIDTPGHEAFSQLRKRGAEVADLAILIIAADEGVKPQTREALEYLKAYQVPFLVVATKTDKPSADQDKVKTQLSELGSAVEGWGGTMPFASVSCKTGEGIEELLELITLVAELHEFTYHPTASGKGVVLEATKDPRRGVLVTAIVKDGQIRTGDTIVTASSFGKVKFLHDWEGRRIDCAVPSTPVTIGGFKKIPAPGEQWQAAVPEETERIQQLLKDQERQHRAKIIHAPRQAVEERVPNHAINLILRADHIGSLETLENILNQLGNTLNKPLKIIKTDVGSFTAEDIQLAKTFHALLIGFHTKAAKPVKEEIKLSGISFFENEVIYELTDQLKEYLRQPDQLQRGKKRGKLNVLAVFNRTNSKATLGGEVAEGVIASSAKVAVLRDGERVGTGAIASLEQDKLPVEEVPAGKLCGLVLKTTADIQKGDLLETV